MKKINIIKLSKEFDDILKTGKKYSNKYYNLFVKENNYKKYRFGICVSKKLGNAVTRNKNKRQVKDIIDKSNLLFSNNKDYVIILKKEIISIKFEDKKKYLLDILKGEKNENK